MATIKTKQNNQTYQESQRVRDARQALAAQNAARPGEYASRYQNQLDSLYKEITERKPFQYDVNADPLFRQYKDQYVRQGKQAMQHTMGQAAALTGGYGNSYAQSAGQQAYNAYLEQLGAVIPELYGQARDQYNQEGADMRANYGLLSDREAQDYNRYNDALDRYLNERDYLAGQVRDEADADFLRWRDAADREYQAGRDAEADRQWQANYDYQQGRDQEADRQWQANFDYRQSQDALDRERQAARDAEADRQWQASFDYQAGRDAESDRQWQTSFDYQKGRDAESDRQWQASFDYQQGRDRTSDEQWQKQFDEQVRQFNAQMAARGSSGGGGGGGGGRGGSGGGRDSGSSEGNNAGSITTQEYRNMEAQARKGETNLDAYLDVMQEKYGLSYQELMNIKSQYTKYFPTTKQDVYGGQRGATGYYV